MVSSSNTAEQLWTAWQLPRKSSGSLWVVSPIPQTISAHLIIVTQFGQAAWRAKNSLWPAYQQKYCIGSRSCDHKVSKGWCSSFLYYHFCSVGRYAYETLINQVPTLLSSPLGLRVSISISSPMSSPLKEADFPEVSFWTHEKWTTCDSLSDGEKMGEQGGSQMVKGINISMRYIEDEHGTIINGFRVKTILGVAHCLFFQLREVGRHPKTWGASGTETLQAYCQEMERQFPELALCLDSCKSKYIATQNYPSWYNSHGKLAVKVDVPDDNVKMDQPSKEHQSSKEDRISSKKQKSEDLQSKQELPFHLPSQVSTLLLI